MRQAFPDDLPLLVELMAEFYAEANYTLNRAHASQAFEGLLADERLGRIWLMEIPGTSTAVGYPVLTFCYSLEFGGGKAWSSPNLMDKKLSNYKTAGFRNEYCREKSRCTRRLFSCSAW